MRYIINFQIKLFFEQNNNEMFRSSYTLLDNESEEFNLTNFEEVEYWFKNLFKNKPLEYFIDTSKIRNHSSLDMKIGRITNSISGEYKIF